MTIYAIFLIVKGCLNLGAALAAYFMAQDTKMAGFWLCVGCADFWVGWLSR
jgi:hypothetical protein